MKRSGFNVRIKNIADLYYDFLSEGDFDEYIFGDLSLCDQVFENVEVSGAKNNNYFYVDFLLEAARKNDNAFFVKELKIPIDFLSAVRDYNLQISQDKNKVIVKDKNGLDEMFIKNVFGNILIGFGSEEDSFRKIINIGNFHKQLLKISALAQRVIIGIYRLNNIKAPRESLVLLAQSDALSAYDYDQELSERRFDNTVQSKKKTTNVVPIEKPKHDFNFIGGQDKAKEELKAIAKSIKHPAIYQGWGSRPAKGVLLEGPSGTGKTILAGALAHEAEANFYNIKISEIFTMWYGESANNIQKIFDSAKEAVKNSGKPSVLFFDEVDALTGSRDSMHEESQRVINIILTNLDGLEPSVGLTVVAASNRKDAIDPTFLRPGRIDKIIEVPLPNEQGRRDIFSIHISACEKTAQRALFDANSLDWPTIIEKTKGMSGAEIAEIVRRTLESKAREELSSGIRPKQVSNDEFLQQINNYEKRSETKVIGFL